MPLLLGYKVQYEHDNDMKRDAVDIIVPNSSSICFCQELTKSNDRHLTKIICK